MQSGGEKKARMHKTHFLHVKHNLVKFIFVANSTKTRITLFCEEKKFWGKHNKIFTAVFD